MIACTSAITVDGSKTYDQKERAEYFFEIVEIRIQGRTTYDKNKGQNTTLKTIKNTS